MVSVTGSFVSLFLIFLWDLYSGEEQSKQGCMRKVLKGGECDQAPLVAPTVPQTRAADPAYAVKALGRTVK